MFGRRLAGWSVPTGKISANRKTRLAGRSVPTRKISANRKAGTRLAAFGAVCFGACAVLAACSR